MNHIYRTLWSVATQSWQAVPETAKTAGKKSKSAAGGVIASVALSFSLTGGAHAQAPPAIHQLPTGGSVVRGTATIQQTATAQAAAMTVNQTSQRAVVNWNTFNIGSAASVNFVQPNAQAVTLNRVNDSNPSQIFGRMTSNGQVVLTNANGIYFAPGSSVDVGAITATTHSITDDNFMSGKYVFERNGATGKIINEGNITAALAGYVALLAPEVQNAGVVVARAGTVAMAAGETITLNIDGAGSLAGITTTPSAIATLIENKQAVQAPDGQIILSAVALNKLQAGVIKNSGSLEANSLVSKGGKIYLEGDDITLSNTSRLEAKGPTGGGTVLVGGDWQGSGDLRQATKVTMEAGATIDASATDKGDGGKVVLWSDVHNADSVTRVNGSIKAEAGANGGDGGQIETSGHVVNVNDIAIFTKSTRGKNGQWLLDPYNVFIMKDVTTSDETLVSNTYIPSKNASYIQSSDLVSALSSGNVTVTTGGALTGSAVGNIYVYDGVAWNANKLTLNAWNNIYVYFPINVTGTGSFALEYGQKAVAASNTSTYYINAPVNLPTGQNFSTKLGNDGATKNFTVINDLGAQADASTAPSTMTVQGMAATSSLAGNFVLGSNIDATATQTWTTQINQFKYFVPIGNGASGNITNNFTGIFDGLGHQISNLKIAGLNPSNGAQTVGFFGTAYNAKIYNVGLINEDVYSIAAYYIGGLMGTNTNSDGTILNNIFTSGVVNANKVTVGGIAGAMTGGSATNLASSSTVSTSGTKAGGIFGLNQNNGAIGSFGFYGTLSGTNTTTTGGLVGQVSTNITNGYYDSTKNPAPLSWRGSSSSNSGTNIVSLATNQLTNQSNFTGLDFVNAWAMGPSYPLPQFMVPNILRVVPSSPTVVYGNTPTSTLSYAGLLNSDTVASAFSGGLPSVTVPANLNAGSYAFSASGGLAPNYSVVYDPATSTITPKPLTISGLSVTTTKVYNNSTAAATSGSGSITFLATEAKGAGSDTDGKPYEAVTVTGTAIAAYNSKDVATANTITYTSGLTLSSSNYSINYSIAGTITPKPLNASGLTLTAAKFYDATNTAAVTGTSGITGGAATSSSTDGKYFSTDTVTYTQSATPTPTATYSQSNVGTGLTITYSGLGTLGGASVSNYSLSTTASVAGAINKATLSLTGSQVYNGTTTFLGSNLIATGVAGQTFALTGSNATLTSADVTATPVSKSFTGITLGASSNGGLVGNYNAIGATANVNISITPATAKLIASKVYDGSQDLTGSQLTVTGVTVSGTTQTLSFSGTPTLYDTNVATANNYVITSGITLTNGTGLASNYVLPSSSYSLNNSSTLSRATAIVNASKTYNGDTSLLAGQVSITGVSIGGIAEVLDFTGTASLSNANVATSNKYVVTSGMTLANGSTGLASNYSLPAGTYSATRNTATINPLALTLTVGTDISAASSVYGNSLNVGAVSFANKVVGDDVNAVVTIAEPAASRSSGGKLKAGDYYQSASTNLIGAQAGNYSFSGITSSTANYSIGQRALVGSGITSAQSVYASALTPGTSQFSNAVADDAVSSTVTVNTGGTSASGKFVAGSYTQTASGLSGNDAANYTFAGYTSAANYTIQKLALTGTSVATSSSTYGSSLAPGAVTWTNVVGADDVSSTATVVTGATSTSNKFIAGTYAQTVASNSLSGTDAGNYSFAASYSTPTNNYTIQKLALTAAGDIASASSTYGSTLTPGSLTFANAVGSDVVNATISVNTSTLSSSGKPIVGNYTQTASTVLTGADADNYTYVGRTSATSNYTINALALTGTSIASATSVYGSAITPGAVSFSNAISGDQVATTASVNTSTLSGAGLPIVGTYTQTTSTTLTGNDASNYTLPTSITSAANYSITKKSLTLSVPGASRMYDGSTLIYPTGAASIQGLIDSDRVVPSAGNVTGFVDKNVGTNKAVTYTGFAFAGADASNYVLSANPASTAEITAKPITVSGITALNREYNGTTTASLNVGIAAPTTGASSDTDNKIYSTDSVSVDTSAAVGTFANANVGTAKPVTITGLALSGTDAGNYIVTGASNATASITPKALTVSGTTVANKTYDGTTAASLSNGTLVGVISADLAHVSLAESGTFADKNVGTAKQVTAADSLSGSAASNYSLTQPTGLSADITKADLSISGITATNKVYDTTTAASLAGTAALNALGNDVVNVSGTGTALFADKNAGTGKTVSVTGFTITGTDASNYNVVQPTGLTADITKADLNISGITAANKVYDATRTATLNGTATVSALANDVVNLAGSGTGQFADKNAGAAKSVSVTGFSLTGADANNYNVVQPAGLTADISKADLAVTGITAVNKVYDATRTATLNGTATVNALANDVVSFAGSGTGQFVDKNIGGAKSVAVSGYTLTGTDADNYNVVQPTGLTADISKADLAVTGITAVNKVYDATRTATLNGTATVSALANDVVSLAGSGTGQFTDKNVGVAKSVAVSGYTLTGTDADNYNVVQPTGLTADISKADLAVTGITAVNKVYDATRTATLNGTATVSALANDVVSLAGSGTGQFADKNVGGAKSVAVSGYTLTGTDANNYNVVQPTGLTADINKAPLTVTAANAVKNLGDANPALTVALTGFVGGETLATSGVTGAGLASTTATEKTDAGAAVISASVGTLAASNYAFTDLVDGTLTIRPISALNNTEVTTLIGAQLANLSGAQVGSFSASQLQVFSPQQLSALSPSQLAGMTTLQLLSLSPAQMAAISPAKIALMTTAELGALTDAQLQALSPIQLAAIAPANFAAFTPAQIMAMSIAQVQNLSPEQLATFSPAQIASLNAAELAYFDARQLAAIGIFPKVETPVTAAVTPPIDTTTIVQDVADASDVSTDKKDKRSTFEAPIPVMTEVATANASAAAAPEPLQAATPVQSAALSPRAVQALLFPPSAENSTRTGVLAITILNSTETKPTTAGIAFEQDADTVSLRFTSAPASVPPMSDKVVFSDKLVTFMVATPSGVMVEFEGSVVNNRMVIVAPSAAAKRVARSEMSLVLAAAVTSLGKENRVILAKLDGVLLDLR